MGNADAIERAAYINIHVLGRGRARKTDCRDCCLINSVKNQLGSVCCNAVACITVLCEKENKTAVTLC